MKKNVNAKTYPMYISLSRKRWVITLCSGIARVEPDNPIGYSFAEISSETVPLSHVFESKLLGLGLPDGTEEHDADIEAEEAEEHITQEEEPEENTEEQQEIPDEAENEANEMPEESAENIYETQNDFVSDGEGRTADGEGEGGGTGGGTGEGNSENDTATDDIIEDTHSDDNDHYDYNYENVDDTEEEEEEEEAPYLVTDLGKYINAAITIPFDKDKTDGDVTDIILEFYAYIAYPEEYEGPAYDTEFYAKYARRCAMFFDGSIVSQDTPRAFFSGNSFYTTAANRMARHLMPEAVTAEDIIEALGGTIPPEPHFPDDVKYEIQKVDGTPVVRNNNSRIENEQMPHGQRKLPKRTHAAMAMILLAIPLTIYFGIVYLGDRKYYFSSLLIILETMLPFFLVFEKRRPQARELVIISVLCAIGVAGRAAFFMLPQFKPVIAMVIISGVAFGGEAGFLVGAVTMLVSNIMFSQGPWTPWQMFAAGLIGFCAGVLFRKGFLRRNRLPLCIFGGLATIIIYGGLMNPSYVFTFYDNPTWQMILSAYVMGFPFDLIHAAATVFFLWFASKPMLEKLDRIKVKYGLVTPIMNGDSSMHVQYSGRLEY